MKISIDTDAQKCIVDDEQGHRELSLYTGEAFEALSRAWLKVGWAVKYTYGFTWMGRPIIQLPEDMVRIQELIYRIKPDVIVETGVAHGGSIIFYASLMKAMGKGRKVVGVDIEIRPHNRRAIEAHELFPMIELVEGSSVDAGIVERVKGLIKPGETVLVILDSNHSYAHVTAELNAYAPLVTKGSYVVSTDGVMEEVFDTPLGKPEWRTDNPAKAARDFVARNSAFRIVETPLPFNEGKLNKALSHWPSAYLERVG